MSVMKKSDETRARIVEAFDRCVALNGYANTKLIDIAVEAGLATPHLRYYFKNKESILEHQYEQIVGAFELAVQNLARETPKEWFEGLGHLLFAGGKKSSQELVVLIEGNSLAYRSERMKKLKYDYDRQILAAIEFQIYRLNVVDSRETAHMVFHFLIGLLLNTAFDSKAERARAIPLFLRFIDQIAGGELLRAKQPSQQ